MTTDQDLSTATGAAHNENTENSESLPENVERQEEPDRTPADASSDHRLSLIEIGTCLRLISQHYAIRKSLRALPSSHLHQRKM
jgi:hypothetical protein